MNCSAVLEDVDYYGDSDGNLARMEGRHPLRSTFPCIPTPGRSAVCIVSDPQEDGFYIRLREGSYFYQENCRYVPADPDTDDHLITLDRLPLFSTGNWPF